MSHDPARPVLTRRALILGGAAVLAGCTRDPARAPAGDPAAPRATRVSPTPRPSPSPMPPPTPAPYVAPAGDALPAFKTTAGRFAQELATYDLGAPPPAPSAAYVGAPGPLAAAAAPLVLAGRWSRAEVEFVQYGGLTPVSPQATSGVAMVVLRQVLLSGDGQMQVVRRTLDLRLHLRQGTWAVEQLASAGGTPVARPPDLGPLSRQVLDDARIDLPDSARWDVYSGQISAALLRVLLRLADVTSLRATVLKTGHPERVVDGRAAAPVSAHFRGRAVDLHSLGGVPVASAPAAVVRSVVQTAGAIPQVSQIGVPAGFDLDAGGRRWFSNLVHADHLHVAVRRAA